MPSNNDLVRKLRDWEEENPFKAIAAGFNPVYGAASGAAAVADPEAAWWEKLLGGVGMVPGLGAPAKATVLLASRLRKYPKLFEKAAKFVDPLTGKKMAEISDHTSSIDKEMLDQLDMNQVPASLEDAYVHPDLFEAEPGLKDVIVSRGTRRSNVAGEYHPIVGRQSGNPVPGMVRYKELPDPTRADRVDDFDNTIRHETQHAADDYAGFLKDDPQSLQPWDWGDYWTRPSEIRARLTAARAKFTPEGRQKYPFDQHTMDEVERLSARRGYGMDPTEAGRDYWQALLAQRGIDIEDLEK